MRNKTESYFKLILLQATKKKDLQICLVLYFLPTK